MAEAVLYGYVAKVYRTPQHYEIKALILLLFPAPFANIAVVGLLTYERCEYLSRATARLVEINCKEFGRCWVQGFAWM